MDYRRLIDAHRASGAAITVSAQAVPKAAARGFGVIGATPDGRIARFVEKPSNPPTLPGRPDCALASMGVYVCDWPWLRATLERDALSPTSGHDFGQDIVPGAVADGIASVFDWSQENGRPTFWRDVGTLDSLLDTCLEFQLGPAPCPLPNVHPSTAGLEATPALSEPIGGVRLARSADSGWAVVKDSVLLAGSRLASGCRLTRTILAPGVVLPPGLIVGEDARADSLWCRVTDNGTRLVTPAMLAQRARRLASAPPWLSTRPAAQMEDVAVGGVAV